MSRIADRLDLPSMEPRDRRPRGRALTGRRRPMEPAGHRGRIPHARNYEATGFRQREQALGPAARVDTGRHASVAWIAASLARTAIRRRRSVGARPAAWSRSARKATVASPGRAPCQRRYPGGAFTSCGDPSGIRTFDSSPREEPRIVIVTKARLTAARPADDPRDPETRRQRVRWQAESPPAPTRSSSS